MSSRNEQLSKVVQLVGEYKGWHDERIKEVTIISIMNCATDDGHSSK